MAFRVLRPSVPYGPPAALPILQASVFHKPPHSLLGCVLAQVAGRVRYPRKPLVYNGALLSCFPSLRCRPHHKTVALLALGLNFISAGKVPECH